MSCSVKKNKSIVNCNLTAAQGKLAWHSWLWSTQIIILFMEISSNNNTDKQKHARGVRDCRWENKAPPKRFYCAKVFVLEIESERWKKKSPCGHGIKSLFWFELALLSGSRKLTFVFYFCSTFIVISDSTLIFRLPQISQPCMWNFNFERKLYLNGLCSGVLTRCHTNCIC